MPQKLPPQLGFRKQIRVSEIDPVAFVGSVEIIAAKLKGRLCQLPIFEGLNIKLYWAFNV